jgi:hypothetical protein
MTFQILFIGIAALFASPVSAAFDENGCYAAEQGCLTEVSVFLQRQAAEAQRRMNSIYGQLQRVISRGARQELRKEQAKWQQAEVNKCRDRKYEDREDELLDRPSCVAWARNRRALELDRRLSPYLLKSNVAYGLTFFPVQMRRSVLGITTDRSFHRNTDSLDIAQSNSQYAFAYSGSGGNQHSCGAAGTARLDGSTLTRLPDERLELPSDASAESVAEMAALNAACRLSIDVLPHHVEIIGNSECHSYFSCGARAGIEGVFFRGESLNSRLTSQSKGRAAKAARP